jgi:hypothetical protein
MAYFGVEIPERVTVPLSVVLFTIPAIGAVIMFFVKDQPLRDDDPTVIQELPAEERSGARRSSQSVGRRRRSRLSSSGESAESLSALVDVPRPF